LSLFLLFRGDCAEPFEIALIFPQSPQALVPALLTFDTLLKNPLKAIRYHLKRAPAGIYRGDASFKQGDEREDIVISPGTKGSTEFGGNQVQKGMVELDKFPILHIIGSNWNRFNNTVLEELRSRFRVFNVLF